MAAHSAVVRYPTMMRFGGDIECKQIGPLHNTVMMHIMMSTRQDFAIRLAFYPK